MEFEQLRQMGQGIALIVCDMDGSLLDSRRGISQRNREAIACAEERGILFSLCSGRIPAMMTAYTRLLGIHVPVIAANGALVYNAQDGHILFKRGLKRQAAMDLIAFCQEHGLDIGVMGGLGGWYCDNSERIKRFEEYNEIAVREGLEQIELRRFGPKARPELQGDLYKALIYELKEGDAALAQRYLDAHTADFAYSSSEAKVLDILAPGVNKGEGLRQLMNLLQLKPEQVCVFGDYYNDLPMIEAAGLSFAMDNAAEEVKRAAHCTTASNDCDGVARAIEKYIL